MIARAPSLTSTTAVSVFLSKSVELAKLSAIGTQDEVSRLPKCFKLPVVYSTDRSKAMVVPVLVLLFVVLWFILRGDLFYVLPCVILFLCFLVLLALRLPRLGKGELILVHLFDLRLFGFVYFLFLLVSEKGCGL